MCCRIIVTYPLMAEIVLWTFESTLELKSTSFVSGWSAELIRGSSFKSKQGPKERESKKDPSWKWPSYWCSFWVCLVAMLVFLKWKYQQGGDCTKVTRYGHRGGVRGKLNWGTKGDRKLLWLWLFRWISHVLGASIPARFWFWAVSPSNAWPKWDILRKCCISSNRGCHNHIAP